MLFRRVLLQFMTGFCMLGGRNGFLRDCSQTKYIFLVLGKWECSSVVKNWTADREVDGKYNG